MTAPERDDPFQPSLAGLQPPSPWHSESREWYWAGLPVIAVSFILLISVLVTRLWESEDLLVIVPWAFAIVALIVMGLGGLFCYHGHLRQSNQAIVARRVRGKKLASKLVKDLSKHYYLRPSDLSIWPSFGYWKVIGGYLLVFDLAEDGDGKSESIDPTRPIEEEELSSTEEPSEAAKDQTAAGTSKASSSKETLEEVKEVALSAQTQNKDDKVLSKNPSNSEGPTYAIIELKEMWFTPIFFGTLVSIEMVPPGFEQDPDRLDQLKDRIERVVSALEREYRLKV